MIGGKTIVMPVDFFDHVYGKAAAQRGLYGEEDIRRLMAAIRGPARADVCLWRLSACGSMTYRSEVEKQRLFDPRAPGRAMGEVLQRYDPLAEAVAAARREGLPIYPWITLFDEGFPPSRSRFLDEHPECQWVDRTGSIYLYGVPCYDYAEAIEFRLRHVREILGYGGDGLYLCLRSHSYQGCPYRQRDFFGFNEPVAAEYRRRYGVDIRQYDDCTRHLNENRFMDRMEFRGGEFDVAAWHRLKGESLTRLLREIRRLAGPSVPIWMCFLGPYEGMDLPPEAAAHTYLIEGIHEFARLHLDWPTWLSEKLIDVLVIQMHHNMPPEYGLLPFEPGVHERGGRLIWFAPVGNRTLDWEQTREFADRIAALPIDGVMPYEAVYFDRKSWSTD